MYYKPILKDGKLIESLEEVETSDVVGTILIFKAVGNNIVLFCKSSIDFAKELCLIEHVLSGFNQEEQYLFSFVTKKDTQKEKDKMNHDMDLLENIWLVSSECDDPDCRCHIRHEWKAVCDDPNCYCNRNKKTDQLSDYCDKCKSSCWEHIVDNDIKLCHSCWLKEGWYDKGYD